MASNNLEMCAECGGCGKLPQFADGGILLGEIICPACHGKKMVEMVSA